MEESNGIRCVSKLGQVGIYDSISAQYLRSTRIPYTSTCITLPLLKSSVFPTSLHLAQMHNQGSSKTDSFELLLFPLWLNSIRFPTMCSTQHRDLLSWYFSHIPSGFTLNAPHRYFHCFLWTLTTENVLGWSG